MGVWKNGPNSRSAKGGHSVPGTPLTPGPSDCASGGSLQTLQNPSHFRGVRSACGQTMLYGTLTATRPSARRGGERDCERSCRDNRLSSSGRERRRRAARDSVGFDHDPTQRSTRRRAFPRELQAPVPRARVPHRQRMSRCMPQQFHWRSLAMHKQEAPLPKTIRRVKGKSFCAAVEQAWRSRTLA